MEGYLSKKEVSWLDTFIGETFLASTVYKFRYSEGLEILNYLQLHFTHEKSLILGTGSLAENIRIVFTDDFIEEMTNYRYQENLIISTEDLTENKWVQFKNKELVSYQLHDKKGYCHNSISLNFSGFKLEIEAGVDELILSP